jgi:alpha-ketoglutarate-dependent 2,4-dichlorophenoxyacetate dioxygenase
VWLVVARGEGRPRSLDLACPSPAFLPEGRDPGVPSGAEVTASMSVSIRQRLVRTHPVTGRRSLYLSSHAGAIVGLPTPEARILLRDLLDHATQPAYVHVHRWRPWDLVMWDNRQVMHRVRRYDERRPRDMRRATVAGDPPTVAPA